MEKMKLSGAIAAGFGAFLLSGLTACGGGGSGGANADSPPGVPTLVSVSVSAPQASLTGGSAELLVAQAHYSDGAQKDVSSQAQWLNSDAAVLQLGNGSAANNVTGLLEGTAQVTATFQGLSGSAMVQVGTPIKSIDIYSAQQNKNLIAPGGSISYAVYAKFQSNGEHEATTSATWSSSDPSIARVSTSNGHASINGIKPGTATLTLSLYGMSKQLPITVANISTVAYGLAGLGFQYGQVAMASPDNVVAAWSDPFSGPMFNTTAYAVASSYSSATGWSATNTSATLQTAGRPIGTTIGANASGVYARAWSTLDGVYATRFTPGSGWQAPQQIFASSISGDAALSLKIAIDPIGNILLVGFNNTSRALFSSTLQANQSTWSPAIQVPGSDVGMGGGDLSMAMNSHGQAAVAWEHWGTRWTTNVSSFDFQSGWGSPVAINSSGCYTKPHLVINDSGKILVSGVNICPASGEPIVFAHRYLPASGWQPVDVFASDPAIQAANACVALSDNDEAVLVWADSYDGSVYAHNYAPSTGWSAAVKVLTPSVFQGTPLVYPPAMTSDGRALALWVNGQSLAGSSAYSKSQGWQTAKPVSQIGFKFETDNVSFAFDKNGHGVVVWSEYYSDPVTQATLRDIYADTLSF